MLTVDDSPQSPELLAILAKLQLAQDRADYAAMTSLNGPQRTSLLPMRDIHDPAHTGLPERTVAEEWLEVRRELSAVANVIASMGAVGTAVWWVGGGRSYAAVSSRTTMRAPRCEADGFGATETHVEHGGRACDRSDRGVPLLEILHEGEPRGTREADAWREGPRV